MDGWEISSHPLTPVSACVFFGPCRDTVRILNNRAVSSGGGLLVGPSSVQIELRGTVVIGNVASASGEQMTMRSGGRLQLHDVSVAMNTGTTSQVGDQQ